MMPALSILPSRNEAYGFFGTITACPDRDRRSSEVWALASRLIGEAIAVSGEDDWLGIRDLLDSRMGRAFADDVAGALMSGATGSEVAIRAAILKWQGWRIDRATERAEGIPAGLTYLTGWVQHFAVLAGMEEAD